MYSWNKTHKPILTINSGDEVTFDNTQAGFLNLTKDTTSEDIAKLGIEGAEDLDKLIGKIYVDGPVYINGAEPGDVLKVEVLELETADWGWTTILPGIGLLMDEFKNPIIKTYDLTKEYAVFKEGIHIPRQPFYGTIGVAPGDDSDIPALFPRNDIGGNFDCRYIGKGSVLYLPINVSGALFAVGDAHYSQGDGEICGTAIETMMKSKFRLTVEKSMHKIQSPHYVTNPELVKEMHSIGGKGEYGVLATAEDETTAAKTAVLGLMDWLLKTKNLSRAEAYMLFSVAGNLKVMHALGIPVHTVSASIPLGLFVE
jgi:acetamidase/formamidase